MNKPLLPSKLSFIDNLNTWLDQNCDQELDVDTIASAMCMERTSLHRHIKKSKGVAIKAYVAKYRIERIIERYGSNPDECITQLAYAVGFGDYRDFARRCQQLYQCSPKHLLKNQKKKEVA